MEIHHVVCFLKQRFAWVAAGWVTPTAARTLCACASQVWANLHQTSAAMWWVHLGIYFSAKSSMWFNHCCDLLLTFGKTTKKGNALTVAISIVPIRRLSDSTCNTLVYSGRDKLVQLTIGIAHLVWCDRVVSQLTNRPTNRIQCTRAVW